LKQILQSLKNGVTEVASVPAPASKPGHLRIASTRSLISIGTERTLLDFGKANFIEKARQQPDKVRLVLDKIKTDGLVSTVESVFAKLDQPVALGYCNVGMVIEVADDVTGFNKGERVVSNGKHAEIVSVPMNLCAKVPDNVSDDEAAFTVIGATALNGLRLAQPTLGETFVVTGLGLVGLMTVQLLCANGCRVLGIDFDSERLSLAQVFGAEVVNLSKNEDPVAASRAFSRGRGVDGVIITASTRSSEPVHDAALMSRKKGRVVLVGVVGLELSRADFYEKELSFQVSCSYGPGRYDPQYENKGHDYPLGYVRWTVQRNFEAVLDMFSAKKLNALPLISHRYSIDHAVEAYELMGNGPALGILLEYSTQENARAASTQHTINVSPPQPSRLVRREHKRPVIAFIGAGNYAMAKLIPAFRACQPRLKMIASTTGVTGLSGARKFGFEQTTTDVDRVFADPEVNVVVIATRHDTHAGLTIKALSSGKNVFCEKPLAMTSEELNDIERTYREQKGPDRLLMIGFNRRFAPQVQKIKSLLDRVREPKAFVLTVNAGPIPPDHWTQDKVVGGGRVIGELCHFIDLLRFLAAAPIKSYVPSLLKSVSNDTLALHLEFHDGSIGTIHYLANGSKSFPKERLEVFVAQRILQLNNFRSLKGFGWPGFRGMYAWRQDKGQAGCVGAFLDAVRGERAAAIPFDELVEVSRVSLNIAAGYCV
jgi:predicted dehydrogenase/threonine dehydrogenase-like Zn-dependent dehydrogenase